MIHEIQLPACRWSYCAPSPLNEFWGEEWEGNWNKLEGKWRQGEKQKRKVMPGACLLSNEAHSNVIAHPSIQPSQCYLALGFYVANRGLTSSSAIVGRSCCMLGQYQAIVEDDILQTLFLGLSSTTLT